MSAMKIKKYLHTSRKHFDPFSLLLSLVGMAAVLWAIGSEGQNNNFFDGRSLILIVVGTFASLLFQFDFLSVGESIMLVGRSFLGTPDKKLGALIAELDRAILTQNPLENLREGRELSGELLNDIIFMHKQGLLFEEIDGFVTTRVADEFLGRQTAVTMLRRAATMAPALGLLGTVVGLVGVLKSLQNPANIGPSMSLALLATAYGAMMNSLLFTPLAGRLDHHNTVYLEIHKQILSKVSILVHREERRTDGDGDTGLRAAA